MITEDFHPLPAFRKYLEVGIYQFANLKLPARKQF
jgi:hypothetical protein